MKADDAVHKYCPIKSIAAPTWHSVGYTDEHDSCVGADCMMWRISGDEGYCGLAGSEVPR
jgi:hypothetical protein